MIPFKPGDPVIEKRTGERGTVHAVWEESAEDNLEILLTNGTYTCRDWRRWRPYRDGHASLTGHYVVVADKGEFLHDCVGVYDTLGKARSRARSHFNDTGEMTDVFQLVTPGAE